MRLIYSFFILLFIFSGCANKEMANGAGELPGNYYSQGDESLRNMNLTPDTRVSEGVIVKVRVMSRDKVLWGLGGVKYKYHLEIFLDDGRVFKSNFISPESFFRGDKVQIIYRGTTLDSIDVVFRN